MNSAAKLVVVSQEDLLGDARQQNVPGTIAEYPSWSLKMAYTLEELKTDKHVTECAQMFRQWVTSSGRGSFSPAGGLENPAGIPRR
jgi:4-alpha-glucanotransferase